MSLFLRAKTTCSCGSTYYTEQERNHLRKKTHQTYLKILETNTDLIDNFLENNCELGSEFKQHRTEIFNSYRKYLIAKRRLDCCLSKEKFYSELSKRGYENKRCYGKRPIYGLRLKTQGQELTDILTNKINIIGNFLEANCEIGSKLKQHRTDVYNSYKKYLEENEKLDWCLSDRNFYKELSKLGYDNTSSNGKRPIYGLRLKTIISESNKNQNLELNDA